MTCFMWSLSCHGHRWEHGMMCHDHGMSMYDMSCLNTGCLAMTVASCPCMTCHGICMKDVPCLCHHTFPRGHGGLLGGQVWGGLSIKKVVASILTNFFIQTITIEPFSIAYVSLLDDISHQYIIFVGFNPLEITIKSSIFFQYPPCFFGLFNPCYPLVI